MAVAGAQAAGPPPFDPGPVLEHAGAALAAGVDPASPAAREVVDRIAGDLDRGARAELAATIATFADRRVERYWALLGVLNGWEPRPPTVPAFEWFSAALRAHA
ncbi:MAG TPA: hypothetical protein VD813_14935 [Pseudonocardia sp.]|nr:hypothetical protein [Pseudonocardia sp.]